jgi:hypothetical protein
VFWRKEKSEEPEGLIWQDEEIGGSDETVLSMSEWNVDCAWCLAEQGRAAGEGSHGICPYHAEQVYQAHRASRRH